MTVKATIITVTVLMTSACATSPYHNENIALSDIQKSDISDVCRFIENLVSDEQPSEECIEDRYNDVLQARSETNDRFDNIISEGLQAIVGITTDFGILKLEQHHERRSEEKLRDEFDDDK